METVSTQMTIHRGLAELKLIDSRIAKAILNINPIGVHQKDKVLSNPMVSFKSFDGMTLRFVLGWAVL